MAIGSGIASQLGGKAESTYGTAVTVDRFWELTKENIQPIMSIVDVPGLRVSSRFQRADRTKRVVKGHAGTITVPVLNKNMGLLFEQALGQDTVTTITGSARRHTCIPDSAAQFGKSMTLQVGRPDIAGTVQPYTYKGCKFPGFTLSCDVDNYLSLDLEVDAEAVATGTSLASASYVATQEPFIWAEAAVTVGGLAFFCKGFTLKYNAALATDRIGLGNTKKQPIANAMASVEFTLDAEFESLTQYAAAIAGTDQALVITFTSATMITGATPYVFSITIPAAEWQEAFPVVEGPDIIRLPISGRAVDDGSNAIMTIVLDNADTAA